MLFDGFYGERYLLLGKYRFLPLIVFYICLILFGHHAVRFDPVYNWEM